MSVTRQIAKLDANENLHPVPEPMMTVVTDALKSLSSGCSAQVLLAHTLALTSSLYTCSHSRPIAARLLALPPSAVPYCCSVYSCCYFCCWPLRSSASSPQTFRFFEPQRWPGCVFPTEGPLHNS